MNTLELLAQRITDQFPDVKASFDLPDKPKGSHWLDLKRGEERVTIEWRPDKGFGFFAPDASYGEGPEKVITDESGALTEALARLGC